MKYEWTVKKELVVDEDMIQSMIEDIPDYLGQGYRGVRLAARAIVEDSVGYELDIDDYPPESILAAITELIVHEYYKNKKAA